VLRLDDDQRAYLCELADRSEYRPARRRPRPKTQVQLQRVIDDMAHTPAFVIGPRTEVVAWNAMGAALITDFGRIPEKQRYYIRLLNHRPGDAGAVRGLGGRGPAGHRPDADDVAVRDTGTKHLRHPVVPSDG
jgi:hypothetical protein